MRLPCWLLFVLVKCALAQDVDPFGNLEEVGTKAPESLKSSDKCGEGSTKGVKICVLYNQCDGRTNTVITTGEYDGFGKIDIRFGENSCDHYLDVCCNLPPNSTYIPTPEPPTSRPITEPPPPQPDNGASYCGIRNENGVLFQITGNSQNEAEFGEFPWMVAIIRNNPGPNDSLMLCGASLITPQVVLTAAHCLQNIGNPGEIKIRAGEWDTQTTREPLPHQDRAVAQMIIHEGFNPSNLQNDVALLVLADFVTKAKNAGTICMPPQGIQLDSRDCIATGWGKEKFGRAYSKQEILKKIKLPIIDKSQCQEALRSTRLSRFFELHESFLCAGGVQDQDTCTGDGGSPLVCPDPRNPRRYVQAGVVSWGIGCGEKNVPGIYADVTQFRQWIDAQMSRLNLNTDPYNL